jgi:hypothetical protein
VFGENQIRQEVPFEKECYEDAKLDQNPVFHIKQRAVKQTQRKYQGQNLGKMIQ